MIRNFSSDSICTLKQHINNVNQDTISFSGSTEAAGVNISEYLKKATSYHKSIIEQNNRTNQRVQCIADDEQQTDKIYAKKIAEKTDWLKDCLNYINSLKTGMNPKFDLVALSCQIKSITQSAKKKLGAMEKSVVNYYLGELRTDTGQTVDGQTVYNYNYDYIKEIMQGNAKDVPAELYTALISTFIDMEKPEDIKQFINSGYKLNDKFPEAPLIGWAGTHYIETDTMKVVTQLMTDSVTALAFATIWSDPGKYKDNKMINKSIEHMQLLQIAEAVAENTPVSVNGMASLYDPNPGIYEIMKSIPLGSPLMTGPEDAWKDRQFTFINYLNDGSIAESIGNGVLDAARDKTLETILVGTGLAAESAAGGVVTVAGIVIGTVSDYIDRMNKLKESEAYLAETETYYNLIKLGGKICYTEVDDVIVVHGIDLQNPEVEKRTMGYVNNNNFGVNSPDEIIRIVLEGDENNPIYKDYILALADGRIKE